MLRKSNKILIPLCEGFEEIELVSIVDVLRRAEIEVVVASARETLQVIGAHQITILADCFLQEVANEEFAGIALVGGMEGVQNMLKHSLLLELIQKFYQEKKLIAAICAAPLVLDKLSLLKEGFTCYPGCETMMKNTTSQYLNSNVVQSQNILTAKGPAFAMEFALEIVKNLKGENQTISQELLLI